MAFSAQFFSDITEGAKVQNISFSVSQDLHYESMSPNSAVHPSTISFTVFLTKAELEKAWKWAIETHTPQKGSIAVMSNDNEGSFVTIEFEEGHCIEFTPDYLGGGSDRMPVHMTIAAKKVTFCDEEIEVDESQG